MFEQTKSLKIGSKERKVVTKTCNVCSRTSHCQTVVDDGNNGNLSSFQQFV